MMSGPRPMKIWRITGSLALHGRRHRHVVVDRHVAPAEHDLAFDAHGALDFLFAGDARGVLLRQEHHADAVFAGRRQLDALLGHLVAEVLVGNLDQDAGAVAHQRVGADRAPVVQVLQDQQALLDDRMALVALDMGDETDAAGIVFIGGIVQTLGNHEASPQLFRGVKAENSAMQQKRSIRIIRVGVELNWQRSCFDQLNGDRVNRRKRRRRRLQRIARKRFV